MSRKLRRVDQIITLHKKESKASRAIVEQLEGVVLEMCKKTRDVSLLRLLSSA